MGPYRAWAIAGAGVAVLVLAAVAVVAVRNVTTGRAPLAATRAARVASERAVEGAPAACAAVQESSQCVFATVKREALAQGDASVCDALANEERDGCVLAVARESQDWRVCDILKGAAQARCEDSARYEVAGLRLDRDICEGIAREALRVSCLENVQGRTIADGSCAAHGVEVALCEDAAEFRRLVATGNLEACEAFDDDGLRSLCVEEMGAVADGVVDETLGASDDVSVAGDDDTDGDGLVDSQEVVYGTNVSNPDTDGDGYSDGEEVSNGYNPLGEGRL